MLEETTHLLHYLYHHSMITSKKALLWFNYKTQNTKNKTHLLIAMQLNPLITHLEKQKVNAGYNSSGAVLTPSVSTFLLG